MKHLGLDLGGTKLAAVVLDEAGVTLWEDRWPAPQGSYEQTLDALSAAVTAAEQALGAIDTVGLGTPGSIVARTGLLHNCNSVWLNGQPLGADLFRRLGRPVRLANDANCFALSEATDGAGAGAASVFGIILGTGVGGGLVLGSQIHSGVHGIAGEWGHLPLPRDARGPEALAGAKIAWSSGSVAPDWCRAGWTWPQLYRRPPRKRARALYKPRKRGIGQRRRPSLCMVNSWLKHWPIW